MKKHYLAPEFSMSCCGSERCLFEITSLEPLDFENLPADWLLGGGN